VAERGVRVANHRHTTQANSRAESSFSLYIVADGSAADGTWRFGAIEFGVAVCC
jgi:hypothetical protein